jgi:hypothetical protein
MPIRVSHIRHDMRPRESSFPNAIVNGVIASKVDEECSSSP